MDNSHSSPLLSAWLIGQSNFHRLPLYSSLLLFTYCLGLLRFRDNTRLPYSYSYSLPSRLHLQPSRCSSRLQVRQHLISPPSRLPSQPDDPSTPPYFTSSSPIANPLQRSAPKNPHHILQTFHISHHIPPFHKSHSPPTRRCHLISYYSICTPSARPPINLPSRAIPQSHNPAIAISLSPPAHRHSLFLNSVINNQ